MEIGLTWMRATERISVDFARLFLWSGRERICGQTAAQQEQQWARQSREPCGGAQKAERLGFARSHLGARRRQAHKDYQLIWVQGAQVPLPLPSRQKLTDACAQL